MFILLLFLYISLLIFFFFFFKKFTIYRLFLFPVCPLVRQVTILSPLRRFFLVTPHPVTCLLVLLFLFMSSYYLGHCSFSPWYSRSGNWNCTKGFLLIVCTVMLQNYYQGTIAKLYIWESLFVEKMHQKKANAKTLCKIKFVPFVPWLPSSMNNYNGK